eukprot:jgi/Botrbrau1/790/Bobra.0181s0043.1
MVVWSNSFKQIECRNSAGVTLLSAFPCVGHLHSSRRRWIRKRLILIPLPRERRSVYHCSILTSTKKNSRVSMELPMTVESNGNGQTRQEDMTAADYYAQSYAHFGIHEEMLKDTVRTRSYQQAILRNRHLFEGAIVLDVGCGTGILSLFAAKAGAKHVYAVEMSGIAEQAKQIVVDNGLTGKVTVIQGKLEEITLPEPQVDIIISEWMGYFLMYESMLNTVLYARDKWLKPDGVLLPDKCSLYIMAIEDSDYKGEKIDFWDNVYGFNMSCIRELAMSEPLVDNVDPEQVATQAALLHTFDISTMDRAEADFSAPFQLTAVRNDYVHAFVAYFDVEFNACHKPVYFSTGPTQKLTHWKQTVFYMEEVLTVEQGEVIEGELTCKANAKNPRDLDITIAYSFNGRICSCTAKQEYRMR